MKRKDSPQDQERLYPTEKEKQELRELQRKYGIKDAPPVEAHRDSANRVASAR